MITAKVLSVAGSANGLLRPIGAAQAQSVEPADGNATAEGGQSRVAASRNIANGTKRRGS